MNTKKINKALISKLILKFKNPFNLIILNPKKDSHEPCEWNIISRKLSNKIRIKYAMVPYENQLNTFFNMKIPPN